MLLPAPPSPTIAIGFRVHSGWAAMVAVAGSPHQPVILDRQRIEIAEIPQRGAQPNQTTQPYHIARELGVERGRIFLDQCRKASNALASSTLESVIKRLGGDRVESCGVLTGSGRPLGTLEATLASHAAIHAAEGEFFRDIIVHATEGCGLRIRRIREKELFELAASEFGIPAARVQRMLNDLGKVMGAPWRQDQKFAALAGWLACTHR